ncbi:hypothetical protein [Agromyces humatus]|uniref:Septum formation-related domain-containing protein n=1 Tax=Agromyces humatus TaxID=279573 RepID=A0ABN2KIF6_9MICO|nr:hypothetical protein [Agromyces humatus]
MVRKKHDDDEDEGTDWLLAQLVTGRTPESQQPQEPAEAEQPAMPETPEPEPEAAAPTQPDLPLRAPSPRREEVLDWFSLAEPPAPVPADDAATRALPVIGEPGETPQATSGAPERPAPSDGPPGQPPPEDLPAWSPPFVASPPATPPERLTQVEPPVSESLRPVEPPPGPVTPTGPFALRWGSNEPQPEPEPGPEPGDSGRAGEPSPPTPPMPPGGAPTVLPSPPTPPMPPGGAPTVLPSPSPSPSSGSDAPFAGFTPPPVTRSSFTPPPNDAQRHPTAPDSAPRGWDERASEPPKSAGYDDELWAALNEPETGTPFPVHPPSTPAPPAHPGVALSLPLTPAPAEPTTTPPPAPAPFPASASAGEPPNEPQGAAPIDDLLAELGNRWAAREAAADAEPAGQPAPTADAASTTDAAPTADAESSAAGVAALGLGFDAADDAAVDEEPTPETGGEAPADAESSIARQVAEAGYFWNLTPDPNAADPNADMSSAAATVNRLRANSPESDPQFEPDSEWQPEPQTEPEQPAAEQHEPAPAASLGAEASDHWEPADEPVESDDHDPLAALFGGAAATPPPTRPAAPLNDPFAELAPLPPAASTAPASVSAVGAGTPFGVPGAPAAPAAGARSAYDVANSARGGSGGSGTGGSSTQGRNSPARILAWIAGSLAAVLVLTGLFFLGTQLGNGTAAPAESPSASATPTPTPEPTAAQPVGVHAWDALFGGECIDPFVGAFEEEFTVVDCAAPHAAQLVYRGVLPGDAAAPFPGEAELASQMNLLCTATGVINLAAVAGMEDLQVQAAYPVTEAQWAKGERHYYCFANRAGGEPLTASIAGPGPAA